jgi:hypothetical protein
MEQQEINVQCIILTNDEVLISQIEEVVADIGEPNCRLTSPYKILGRHETDAPVEERFVPWLADITDDNVIMISSDKILTLVEPHRILIDHYLKIATT